MKAEQITDDEIRGFLEWFFTHYKCDTERVALLAISTAGHFHMTEKTATPLIKRAIASGFLTADGKDKVKRASGIPSTKGEFTPATKRGFRKQALNPDK